MLLNSFLSVFDLLLASFLRGCLVGLLSLGCSPFSFFFRVVCWSLCLSACYLLRPALFVLVCRVLFGLCAFLVVFLWCCGFVLAFGCCCFFLLGCFARLCFVWGCFGLARSLLASFPPVLPAPSVSPLVPSGPVSVLLALPGIWLYLRRPGCHACGMVCCDGLAPVFTSPRGNKGFGPVWGSALYTMLRVLFRCPSFLH